jgi:hypothetical protein
MNLVVFLPFLFLEEFEEYWCQFFFKGMVEFGSEFIDPGLFLVGRFFITASVSLLFIDLVKWFILLVQFWQVQCI